MKDIFRLIFGLLVVVIIIGFGAKFFESFVTEDIIEVTIKKIEVIDNKPDEKYYLIYTDKETLENRNHTFHNKVDSELIRKELLAGRAYKVRVVGYNLGFDLPFFSKYRNIVEVVQEIKLKKKTLRRLN